MLIASRKPAARFIAFTVAAARLAGCMAVGRSLAAQSADSSALSNMLMNRSRDRWIRSSMGGPPWQH